LISQGIFVKKALKIGRIKKVCSLSGVMGIIKFLVKGTVDHIFFNKCGVCRVILFKNSYEMLEDNATY